MTWPVFILIAFACGSIPFGLLIARARGIDIRKHGSGNIGATNVGRVLGLKLGFLCFGLDVAKGLAPVFIAGYIMGVLHPQIAAGPIPAPDAWWWLGVVVCAVLGHMFSPFIGFRGGKGVATGLGAMLGLWPYLTIPAIGALILWIIAAAIWRYVSLASCLAALSLPLWVFLASRFGSRGTASDLMPFYVITSVMGLLVIYRHRANIKRLLAGTENKLGRRAKLNGAPPV
jgi:glycerol-3-phosphate acyltransferase PlsY